MANRVYDEKVRLSTDSNPSEDGDVKRWA